MHDTPDAVFRSALPLQTVSAQGSLAPEALPSFIATTSPWADPDASRSHFVLRTYSERPCRLHHPRLVTGTFPTLVYLSVLECCALYTGGSSSAFNQFFLGDIGLRLTTHGSALRVYPHQRLPVGYLFQYGRHSLMLRPSSLLALLTVRHRVTAPEDVLRSSFLPIRYPLGSRVCYPADWSIAGAGLSPARKAAVVGCTIVQVEVSQERTDRLSLSGAGFTHE